MLSFPSPMCQQEKAMPKVTMFFDPRKMKLTQTEQIAIGMMVRPLVAKALSTEAQILDPQISIDFITKAHSKGSLVNEPFSFEIETAAKPERVAKLTLAVALHLRDAIVEVLKGLPEVDEDYNPRQLVWIKFIDPRGPHV